VRTVDHIATTVADLDSAIDFVIEVLGGALCYRQEPVEDPDGDWMTRKLGVHPRASADIAMLRLGPTTNLELFQYRAPDQRVVPPRPWDVGAHRFVLGADGPAAAAVRVWARSADRLAKVDTPLGSVELRDGIDMMSYVVADLAASVAFLVDVFGAVPLSRDDFGRSDDPVSVRLGVDPDGEVGRAVLRLGAVTHVEFVEYRGLDRRWAPPRNSDVGGHHIAFHATDVDAAAEYLSAWPGIEVLGPPETVPDGPIAGDRWVYFRTPIGIQMEVLNMPDGSLPYELQTSNRRAVGSREPLVRPSDGDRDR
jgi:catechol 2,3-dioxygenase-like lactoylglutathione lyase family enzyme